LNPDLLNPRRAPRVPARFPVALRHRFSSWSAETEDVGPRGCQLVTPRLVSVGRDVTLEIECPALGRQVRAAATVIWARPAAPSRLGVAFRRDECGWFDELLAADPAAARVAQRTPERLPCRARLHLGEPPRDIVDFTPDELAVLRRVGGSIGVEELVRSFGSSPERVTGALFSLVARGLVVLDPLRSPGPARWRPVFAQAGSASTPAGARSPAVERLRAEALDHLAAGRLPLAVQRLRDALAIAPGNQVVEAELERLAPFA
jgi:hypothetical protein